VSAGLFAISDLHLGHAANREALMALPPLPDDWLIVAGDVGETLPLVEFAWRVLVPRFARIIWTPGNHDLWTLPQRPAEPRGVARYEHLVALCRHSGVITPEDPFPLWRGQLIAPIFTLYDYSFRPDTVSADDALAWAAATRVVCADETMLHPDPFPSRAAWCAARCALTEARLAALPREQPLIVVSHFPLHRELAVLPRIPRFSLWCGTRLTEPWLTRFPVTRLVYGHLHIRRQLIHQGVQCDEVSLGYPTQWDATRGLAAYLRRIDGGE
jgi:3',5'-cyclic AMP phosphodiesterase CpdA